MIKHFVFSVFGLIISAGAFAQSQGEINLQCDAELFETKCTGCHTVGLSFRGRDVLPTDVWCMVIRMANWDGGNIYCCSDRVRLYTFLVDWIAKHRADELEQALKCNPCRAECERQLVEEARSRYK